METRKNLTVINAPQSILKNAGSAHFNRLRRDVSPRQVRGCFESAFSNAPIGMALMHMNGHWLHINSALCRITGYTESELKAIPLRSITHPDDIDLDVSLYRQLFDGEISSYQVEMRCRLAWGQYVWMMKTVSLVRDEEGRTLYRIMQFQDISERMELAGRLEYLADHDCLTGIQGNTEGGQADWLRKSLEEDLFLLYCQPILDLKTNEVSQYELLLRLMGNEDCEHLAPNAFLYVAERYGVILAIDSWVVCKAIAMIGEYERSGRRLTLNVNLSGNSIGDPQLAGFIEKALAEGGIDPSCLVFELTEAAAITNLQQTLSFADWIHQCGCRLVLDNVGADLAFFYCLKNLHFDYLKIKGEFIRHLSVNPVDQLIVKAIVSIAQGMGKKTVAKFVADAYSVRLLRDSGVDYAQGYHIGLPKPVTEYLQHSP